MKKRMVAGLLVLVAVLGMMASAWAHESQDEHDGDLKSVLFGDRGMILTGDNKRTFQAIADAAALCIDQFSPNEESRWKEDDFDALQAELSSLGLPTLDVSFDAIDLSKTTVNSGKNVTANTHRQYTHQGWNCKKHPDKDFWQLRKDILRDTANRVLFNPQPLFSWTPWLNDILSIPNEQCDAFCGMVYYVHILGDHIGGDVPEKLKGITPLIQYTSFSTPGIIVELEEQLQVLFVSQNSDKMFLELMQELENIKMDAEKNCGMWGDVDTEEKCAANMEYAKKVLEKLSDYVRALLKDEPFFYERFPQ